MPTSDSSANTNTNASSNTQGKNPCGLCRASGQLVCKGHGGGGGGGGGSGGSSSDSKEEASIGTTLSLAPKTIASRIAQGLALAKPDELESTFILDNPNALFSMKLEMGLGTITLRGKKDLSKEDQATLNEFFKTIETELSTFKKELIAQGENPKSLDQIKVTREGNTLSLRFPSPAYYDAFVEKLMDKNLYPAVPDLQRKNTQAMDASNLSKAHEEASQPYKSTTPSPFDIRNGPKPKGFE